MLGIVVGGPPAPAIHADADLGIAQHASEGEAGKLATLIHVEDFWSAEPGLCPSSAATQKPASIVFDRRQANTLSIDQSIIATR